MIKGNASADTISKILDRLANDDAFREQMLGDPKSALAPYGLELDMSQVPAVRKLPSKEHLRASRAELQKSIEGNLGLIPFLLK